jgi:Lipocalin-like domain
MTRAAILLLATLLSSAAHALEINKDDLVGAWEYVSTYSQWPSGRKAQLFSDEPQGIFVLLPNGIYSHIIMAKDLPRVRSGKFKETTLAEAEKLAEGTLAHFGTYTVDEQAGKFTVIVRKSSFPNIDGATQVRTITKLDRDNLHYENDLSVAEPGVKVVAFLRRVW